MKAMTWERRGGRRDPTEVLRTEMSFFFLSFGEDQSGILLCTRDSDTKKSHNDVKSGFDEANNVIVSLTSARHKGSRQSPATALPAIRTILPELRTGSRIVSFSLRGKEHLSLKVWEL